MHLEKPCKELSKVPSTWQAPKFNYHPYSKNPVRRKDDDNLWMKTNRHKGIEVAQLNNKAVFNSDRINSQPCTVKWYNV